MKVTCDNEGINQDRRVRSLVASVGAESSDYSGFVAKIKKGYHPFGMVGMCIQGAMASDTPVPFVAARNSFDRIADVGQSGQVTMRIWTVAEEAHLDFAHYANAQDREPRTEHLVTTVTYSPAVPRRIEYVTHDAGRQLIGSFHPTDRDFFADAYGEP